MAFRCFSAGTGRGPGFFCADHQFLDKVLAALDHGLHVLISICIRPPRAIPVGFTLRSEALGRDLEGLDPAKPLTLVSYRAGGERRGYAQPLAVGDRLADMPLFLTADRYVNVPLEETYTSAFANLPRQFRAILEREAPLAG